MTDNYWENMNAFYPIRQSWLWQSLSSYVSLINNKISRISSCILTFGWHTLQYDVRKYCRSVLTSALPPHHWHCSLCRYSDCVDISRYLVQVFGRTETVISCGGLKLCPCWRPQLQPLLATLPLVHSSRQTRGLGPHRPACPQPPVSVPVIFSIIYWLQQSRHPSPSPPADCALDI